MLIYHPVYDVHHCLYRILMILEAADQAVLHIDQIRLLDFYVLFPHLIKEIRPFPSELRTHRQLINEIPTAYERVQNPKRVMFELESIQTTALQNLLAKGLLDLDCYQHKKIRRSETPLPGGLLEAIHSSETYAEEWFKLLTSEFCQLRMKGRGGLKSRSGLMEFRYDLEQS